jgi:quercetin dioxygenase-like cupin family protein
MVRRVVSGHDEQGRSCIVSDDAAYAMAVGDAGTAFHVVWGRDDPAHFPDSGAQPRWAGGPAPVGGSRFTVLELPPGDSHQLDTYVVERMTQFADATRPGMHATPTMDFDIVLSGTVGLELDDGEAILHPGDVVVLNGTSHRWHNRGTVTAMVASIMVGARHDSFPISTSGSEV